ncbi:transmembrane protein 107 isoform X1 [Nannospalax galili]|uniref:transmembrane protein 107 isoform X1 n=1 Tax=Nannospalax galili TaxID=1026970 RepID=UPI000819BF37|nr:transmembrane protein 107 isoform X1 [Nannospalax galili]
MGRISGLVPSRFLTLLAHLVIVITLFWSRESNIQACLPLRFTPEEYEKQDVQLVASLCLTLALFAVELAGFLSGVSMFNSTQSLLCILYACPPSPCDSQPSQLFLATSGLSGTKVSELGGKPNLSRCGNTHYLRMGWKVSPKSEGFPHPAFSSPSRLSLKRHYSSLSLG